MESDPSYYQYNRHPSSSFQPMNLPTHMPTQPQHQRYPGWRSAMESSMQPPWQEVNHSNGHHQDWRHRGHHMQQSHQHEYGAYTGWGAQGYPSYQANHMRNGYGQYAHKHNTYTQPRRNPRGTFWDMPTSTQNPPLQPRPVRPDSYARPKHRRKHHDTWRPNESISQFNATTSHVLSPEAPRIKKVTPPQAKQTEQSQEVHCISEVTDSQPTAVTPRKGKKQQDSTTEHEHRNKKQKRHGVPPDMSKGFADLDAECKYDELPPQLPAFLPATAAKHHKTRDTAEIELDDASEDSTKQMDDGQVSKHQQRGCSESNTDRTKLPILLFDLNGTLTSHTHKRRSSGITRVRPGVAALAKLAIKFRIGIFSSATHRTVADARALIEKETAGLPLFEPGLILHRDHTVPAPAHHIQAGGKDWDTAKPLGRWFADLDRVLLFDDDEYKALEGEQGNMVLVPGWKDEDPDCPVLQELAAAIEQVKEDISKFKR